MKYIEIEKAIDIVSNYYMVDNDAERFFEDEMRENATDLLDRVLEIIDDTEQAFVEDGIEGEAIAVEHAIDRIKELRSEVLALQGGGKE